MHRDAWEDRRELLEYALKEHCKRGGRVSTPPQTAMCDPKLLDQINVTGLIQALRSSTTTGTIDIARLLYPPNSNGGPPARSASAAAFGAPPGDNPFGAAPAASASASPGSNPFAPAPAPSSQHSRHASKDNPFGGPSTGGDAGNPFTKTKPKAAGSAREPPIITPMAVSQRLSYGYTPPASGAKQSAARSEPNGAEAEEGADGGRLQLPKLDRPELETGQTDDELRDLAYLLFAACATTSGLPQHAALLPVLRQQLLIDEARAADVARVLRHVQPGGGGKPHLMDALHPLHTQTSYGSGGWRPSQLASLELLLRLIAIVRPSDFEGATPEKAFKGFLRWKDVAVAVLEKQLAAAVEGSWTGDKAQLKKLLARMHGAARRADVRGESDFEEEEYSEATRALADVAAQLAAGCATGMRFPWAVRVRLSEILVTALFDTIDEGALIDEAALVLQFLDSMLWPALGVSPTAALAVSAWVHFSMYVGTGCKEQRLVKQLKSQIAKLASTDPAAKLSDTFGLGADAAGVPDAPPPPEEAARDRELSAVVANQIVAFAYGRLCDYHAAFPKGENMAAILDVFVFACKSRGDGPERLCELLVEAVTASTAAQFARLEAARVDSGAAAEAQLLELATVVHELHDADAATFCSPAILAAHLPEALAVACVQLHKLYSRPLGPWLANVNDVTSQVLDVFRTTHALETRLQEPITAALDKPASGTASRECLASHKRWDLAAPLQRGMLAWVASQVVNMNTWLARALASEKWRPLGSGPETSHTQSAADVVRMADEALDALYGMDVPMPPAVPTALLDGIDALLQKYVTHVIDKLGPVGRLVPPLPLVTRYKKDVVVKQETAEIEEMKGNGGKAAKKASAFLQSVPTINSSPDFTNISNSLTTEVITAAACSLNYLHVRAGVLLQAARNRALQSVAVHGAVTPPANPASASPPSKPLPAKQPSEAGVASSEPPEPLSQARAALLTGMQYACKFLATRVVFWDQRAAWFEQLYRHHATAPLSRIDRLLESQQKLLSSVCPSVPESVRSVFARQLVAVSVQAYERVLLDGGPCRWFTPNDVSALEQDLSRLRSLYVADGEGLDPVLVDGDLERLRKLLALMRQEVGPLMDMLKAARTHGTAQLHGSGPGGYAYDESTIMRVIARRPERNGSKLLKTLYKTPKKLK